MCKRFFRLRQGNALVLSVLITLSLASVGVVALNRTGAELSLTGNVVRSSQALMAAEAAATKCLGDFRSNLQVELINFQQQNGRFRWGVAEGSTALVQGADQKAIPLVSPGDANWKAAVEKAQAMAFSVGAVGGGALSQVCDVAGFEVNEICFAIFQFEATGMLPQYEGQSLQETKSSRTTKNRYNARVMLGPWRPIIH